VHLYYTNEYLKTNGAFNWSTRIAPSVYILRFGRELYGTVTAQSLLETGAPISGVRVALVIIMRAYENG
jgi:hypothetical protein